MLFNLIDYRIRVIDISISQKENTLFQACLKMLLTAKNRHEDFSAAEVAIKPVNLAQRMLLCDIIVGYGCLACWVLHSKVVGAKAHDGEFAVHRKGTNEYLERILGKIHAVVQAHASAAIDNKEEVEIFSVTELRLLRCLVLHNFEEILRLHRIEGWH